HLELKRYFGIDELLDEQTAGGIWEKANGCLAEMPVHTILERNRVTIVCTTDDPTDTLEFHAQIRNSTLRTRVYPTYRPDKALTVGDPRVFNPWTDKLSEVSGVDCSSFSGFLDALRQRHDFFHAMGSRLSDHGLSNALAEECTEA